MPEKNAEKLSWSEMLKTRWQLKSGWQVLLVLLTFACTGFSVLFLKKPLYALVGITEATPLWLRAGFYTLAILPVYQVLLLAWGFVFGQFRFFWNFEKKMFNRMASFFRR
jgi:hypothetical protein